MATVPSNWQQLTTLHDIETLMKLFHNFHDGCVREIHVATGYYVEEDLAMTVDWRTTVHMLVQRQFREPSAIELRFEEIIGLMVSPPPPDYEAIIRHAAFFLREGVIYWADGAEWTPELADRDEYTWVAARRAFWRDASHWLGSDLRYRQEISSF